MAKGDFEHQRMSTESETRRHANSIMSKHGDHDDLDKPGPVAGKFGGDGGKLKHLHIDFANNGYSVHHSHEGGASDKEDASGPAPAVEKDFHHVHSHPDDVVEHVKHLLGNHHKAIGNK